MFLLSFPLINIGKARESIAYFSRAMPALKRVLTNWKHQIISAVAEWQKKEEARKSREGVAKAET